MTTFETVMAVALLCYGAVLIATILISTGLKIRRRTYDTEEDY